MHIYNLLCSVFQIYRCVFEPLFCIKIISYCKILEFYIGSQITVHLVIYFRMLTSVLVKKIYISACYWDKLLGTVCIINFKLDSDYNRCSNLINSNFFFNKVTLSAYILEVRKRGKKKEISCCSELPLNVFINHSQNNKRKFWLSW